MRAIGTLLLAISAVLAAPPARAQTYDPAYPICLQRYGIDGSSISCRYVSLAQCQVVASGRAAHHQSLLRQGPPALLSVATICTGLASRRPQRPFGELPDR
jgi:Protein of unknown function (DUF3551)